MTVNELSAALGLNALVESEPERECTGGYAGDLLSWVMGRAKSGDVWFTIMSNANIVAVATLADVAMVVLAEGVMPEAEVLDAARGRGINLYSSSLSVFELCAKVSALL